jgi:hypothetical protein
LCGNFWLLTAEPDSSDASHAWYLPSDRVSPRVHGLTRWHSWANSLPISEGQKAPSAHLNNHPIPHYLVLPAFEWGITDWHLNAARPFIRKYRPMIGFSLNYAGMAERVTVVGSSEQFPEADLDQLRNAGCLVERISGDGMSIATQLAEK